MHRDGHFAAEARTGRGQNQMLVIAPHGDDEINLIGAVAERFVRRGWHMTALFVTNGDWNPEKTEQRHRETLQACKAMGIEQTVFLGYADDPGTGGRHTFQTSAGQEYISPAGHRETYGVQDTAEFSAGEEYVSPAGHNETYGAQDAAEFSFLKRGHHHSYCRENVKQDLKDCILEELADLIVCVDFDEHADHQMTSLLFDEAMGEIIAATTYRPIVLKRYAYAGVWFGPDDYLRNPMRETVLSGREFFPNTERQAVRASVSRKQYPVRCRRSPVYRLCEIYQSQYAWEHFTRMVNADALFFYRDCDNLAFGANVTATSGKAACVNDFKLIDAKAVPVSKEAVIDQYAQYTWVPGADDPIRTVTLEFETGIRLKELRVHYPFQSEFRPRKLIVTVNGEPFAFDTGLEYDDVFSFPDLIPDVKQVRVQIAEGLPGKCGIREIEIFDHPSAFPWDRTPLKPYNPKSLARYRLGTKLVPFLKEKGSLLRQFIRYDLRGHGFRYYWKRIWEKLRRLFVRK